MSIDDVCQKCGEMRTDHTPMLSVPGRSLCPPAGKPVVDEVESFVSGKPAGGHPEYLKLLDEMRALHQRKAADYGRGADPFANVRSSGEFGIPAWVGVMVRTNDKLHRVKSFIANGSLKNESIDDSLMDLAAYALIALVLLREGRAAEGGRV